ncbi:hypothetical protein GEMRC1_011501 [Eukaryota sp. GEM-RC1]
MEKATSSLPCPSKISRKTLRYAKELCHGVLFLHSNSIVHGDLKPANILLVSDAIRIADFGTSRNLQATATSTTSFGLTHKYSAPEQFDNILSPMSDVFSLGIILYEMLTNHEAFHGLTATAMFGAKMKGNLPPLFSFWVNNTTSSTNTIPILPIPPHTQFPQTLFTYGIHF